MLLAFFFSWFVCHAAVLIVTFFDFGGPTMLHIAQSTAVAHFLNPNHQTNLGDSGYDVLLTELLHLLLAQQALPIRFQHPDTGSFQLRQESVAGVFHRVDDWNIATKEGKQNNGNFALKLI
uniref:Secreted protein n=1 Tax=Steinernema glaseri TaxID=37863 RepID=A0A1I7ZSP5_9BILA